MTNDRLMYGILFSICKWKGMVKKGKEVYLCLLIVYEPGEGSRRVRWLGGDTLNNKKDCSAFMNHHFQKYI